ncbi:MAG: serine protease [Desulfotomaculaceae bacterium]|nr:serine protease [Desulfotomaculaceae bacterium]
MTEACNDRDPTDNESASGEIADGTDFIEEKELFDEAIDNFDENEEVPSNRPLWLRLIALVAIMGFLGLVAVTSWPNLRWPQQMANLVLESLRLKKEIDPAWLKAVVQIDVVYRDQGPAYPVAQKSGTGFNIEQGGQIITNHHVVAGALNISVTFPDGKIFKGEQWTGAPEYDLAVIKLRANGLPVVPLNMFQVPQAGDTVRVVGNPLDLKSIVVEGKIIQYLTAGNTPGKVFSIDAPIYPGNSGSPVFDSGGQVVGVVFGRLTGTQYGREPPALAVPIGEVTDLFTGGSE